MEQGSNIFLAVALVSQVFHLIQENKPDISFWVTVCAALVTIISRLLIIQKELKERRGKNNN